MKSNKCVGIWFFSARLAEPAFEKLACDEMYLTCDFSLVLVSLQIG